MRTEASVLILVGSLSLALAAGCADDSSSSGAGGSGAGSGTGAGSTGTNTGSTGTNAGGASTGTNAGGASTGTNAGGASTGTAAGGAGVGGGAGIGTCKGKIYECGDGLDNDQDGLTDSNDPDCLGVCDNTEDSYFGGIPGQNNAPCKMDCYFDFDSGSGNDDCYWDHRCDPHEVAPGYYPEPNKGSQCEYDPNFNVTNNLDCTGALTMQSQGCTDYCAPLTPNGCDCFGCCVLPGAPTPVYLGSVGADGNTVCDIAHIADPTFCHPCIQVEGACNNPCDPCEICIGKPLPDPSCNPTTTTTTGTGSTTTGTGSTTSGTTTGSTTTGGGGTQCPSGVQACGLPGQSPCPTNYYCVTGCCQQIPG